MEHIDTTGEIATPAALPYAITQVYAAVERGLAALWPAAVSPPAPPTPPAPDPARLEDWPVERLIEIYLARRRYWLQHTAPPPDALGTVSYEDLYYHLKARYSNRKLNPHIHADDAKHGRGPAERTGFNRPGPLVMPVPKAW